MTKFHFLNSTALALVCALSLAACDKQDASSTAAADNPLPLTNGPVTAIVAAPAPAALPAAPRPKIVARTEPQDDDYSYVDRAYAMSDAIGDAPPDYGFDYRDSHPWVWRSDNRSVRMVEPVSGGYRDYYYQPGADRPYLVRDPDYAYGFSNGELVAVYDRNGRLLPYQELDGRDEDAGRILARAIALYDAALQSQRQAINAANWAAQQSVLANERADWLREQNQQDSWRSYHAAHEAQDQNDWSAERNRRDQSARSFNDWRTRGFAGPPPPVTAANRNNAQQQQDQARQQQQQDQARAQQQQADQARAQQQQADQARQQQDAARQQQDAARQQQDKARQQQDQARTQQQQADQARQQQDAARQQQDKARQQQDQARAQQQQADQARQQQDAARQAADKAKQQQAEQTRQQQDAARQADAKARQDQARTQPNRGRGPGDHRGNEAPASVPPVAAAAPAATPAPAPAPLAKPPVAAAAPVPAPVAVPAPKAPVVTPPVVATPAAVAPPPVVAPPDRKAQQAARQAERKKREDEAKAARDGKPPQP